MIPRTAGIAFNLFDVDQLQPSPPYCWSSETCSVAICFSNTSGSQLIFHLRQRPQTSKNANGTGAWIRWQSAESEQHPSESRACVASLAPTSVIAVTCSLVMKLSSGFLRNRPPGPRGRLMQARLASGTMGLCCLASRMRSSSSCRAILRLRMRSNCFAFMKMGVSSTGGPMGIWRRGCSEFWGGSERGCG